jgi:hypothetical protein
VRREEERKRGNREQRRWKGKREQTHKLGVMSLSMLIFKIFLILQTGVHAVARVSKEKLPSRLRWNKSSLAGAWSGQPQLDSNE